MGATVKAGTQERGTERGMEDAKCATMKCVRTL